MTEFILKIQALIHDMQIMAAVIFGMFVQFFLGRTKSWRMVATIIISSICVAWFVVPILLEVFRLEAKSAVGVAIYGLSSVISVELLAVLIAMLPKAVRDRVESALEIDKYKREFEDESDEISSQ
jgi:hypothetical protein